MTNREAYVLGWTWGRIDAELDKYDISGTRFAEASKRPLSGMALIMQHANKTGVLKGRLDKEIGAALNEINMSDEEMSAKQEAVSPFKLQGTWQIGCTMGRAKKPLPPETQE